MAVERVPIADLLGDPANVRKHSARNLDAIKASLARFGQQKPIVVDAANVVRAGNGTLAAALALGWTHLSVVRTALSGADATAYAIADNRTAELAEWSDDLAQQLAALQIEDDALLEAAGFTDAEFDALVEEATDLDPDGEEAGAELGGLEFRIVVECDSEDHQAKLLDQFDREGLKCRALTS